MARLPSADAPSKTATTLSPPKASEGFRSNPPSRGAGGNSSPKLNHSSGRFRPPPPRGGTPAHSRRCPQWDLLVPRVADPGPPVCQEAALGRRRGGLSQRVPPPPTVRLTPGPAGGRD